jgi:hypothetical protein
MNDALEIFGTAAGEVAVAITPEMLDRLEAELLAFPQIEVPIKHTFCNGLYIREGVLPAGGLILGHSHKEQHHCVVLSGKLLIFNFDRTVTEINGPASFIGEPGRKLGLSVTEVVMQNIHPTANWPADCFGDVVTMEEHLYAITTPARAARMNAACKKEICA